MSNEDVSQNRLYKGFKSVKDKSEFTSSVIVLVVLLMAVPFVFSMIFMPYFMSGRAFSMDVPSSSGGTYYGGKIYYPAMQMNQDGGETILKAITPGSEEKAENLGAISLSFPRLMEYNGRLLIFSNYGVDEFKDGKIEILFRQILGSISQPFIYEGKPAVIESKPDGFYLNTLSDKKWEKVGKVYPEKSTVKSNESAGRSDSLPSPGIQVLNLNGEYFYFYYSDKTLYMHKGIPFVEDKKSGEWTPIENNLREWTAVSYDGKPAVILGSNNSSGSRSSLNSNIIGLKYDGGSWTKFFEHKGGMVISMGAYPMEEKSGLYILYCGFPGNSHLLSVKDGIVAADQKIGKGFFSQFPLKWIFAGNVIIMFFYLIIVFSISKSMSKHRIPEYSDDTVNIPFAPLWKRAAARMIDSVFMMGPVMLVYYKVFTDFFENFSPQSMMIMAGNVLACFLWAIIVGIFLSFMEGKSGKTPGKMLMKIKVVGTDNQLLPVGFGRAIIRNLLMIVDSFFHYMVGVLLIAFMDNWQRVGDMAAKTIVVEDNGSLEERAERCINTDNV